MPKTVLITGAGSGFGRGAAVALAARGHTVIAAVESEEQAAELEAAHPELTVTKLDVTDPDDLPVVDQWNVWWSIYGNSVDRFAEVKAGVDTAMPEGRSVEATCAVLVTLGGSGRVMGNEYDAQVAEVTEDDLADHLRGLAALGVTHVQLVLDPITADSIARVGEVLADLDREG